jgi:hypothetical protein
MWAGGDPRSYEEACYPESTDVLRKLKPNPDRDNLPKLLHCASILRRNETLEYLLGIGAQPNDKKDGGCSALDSVLNSMGFAWGGREGADRLISRYEVRRTFDCISVLVSHGAIWRPDNGYEMTSLRRALVECEPSITIELLQDLPEA